MKILEGVCIGLILCGPVIFKEGKKEGLKSDYKDGVVGGFNVVVNDIKQSNSGFNTCISYIKNIDKQVVGPCVTSDGIKLKVGYTYTVERAIIKGDLLSISKVVNSDGESGVKMKVVSTFVRARTPLMELEDGRIVGNNDGIKVGEYVSVN
jgi:hypothetical protein